MKHTLSLILISLLFCLPESILAQNALVGNGQLIREMRRMPEFDGVVVGGAFDVYLYEGDCYCAEVETDENLLDHIQTTIKDGKLYIESKGWVKKSTEYRVFVTLPRLSALSVSGAADVVGETPFDSRRMELHASGSSDISLEISVDVLTSTVSGSSDVNLRGRAEEVSATVSGSGDLKASSLQAERVEVGVSGSGDAYVHARRAIRASASGSGDVYCHGNPGQTSISTSGAGDFHLK